MKSGFTLIELLIVMVIVGILVTIALPKYNASLERARAQEGIANLKAASDIINAHYVMNGNEYSNEGITDGHGNFITGDFIKSKYFTTPNMKFLSGEVTKAPAVSRMEGGESLYSLVAVNGEGEFHYITCSSMYYPKYCEEIGGVPQAENPNIYIIDAGN